MALAWIVDGMIGYREFSRQLAASGPIVHPDPNFAARTIAGTIANEL
jgi:hypothetical protein